MRIFKSSFFFIFILLLSSCSNDFVIEKISSDSNINGVSNKTKNFVEAVRLVEGINNSMRDGKEVDINKVIKDVTMMYNQNNAKKEGNYNEIKIEKEVLYTSHNGEFEITILEKMVVLGERIK
jgi:hypothetical protein